MSNIQIKKLNMFGNNLDIFPYEDVKEDIHIHESEPPHKEITEKERIADENLKNYLHDHFHE